MRYLLLSLMLLVSLPLYGLDVTTWLTFNDADYVVAENESTIWWSGHGLVKYSLDNGSYETYTVEDGLPSVFTERLVIYEGEIWVHSDNGIVVFDGYNFREPDVPDVDNLVRVLKDNFGRLYAVYDDGILKLEDGTWKKLELPESFTEYSEIDNASVDRNGWTWLLAHNHTLFEKDGIWRVYAPFSPTYVSFNCSSLDSLGNYWIGANVGVYKLEYNAERDTILFKYVEDFVNPVLSITADDNGDMWAVTKNRVHYFDFEYLNNDSLYVNSSIASRITYGDVEAAERHITAAGDNVFIASSEGIIVPQNGDWEFLKVPAIRNGAVGVTVDKEGNIWCGGGNSISVLLYDNWMIHILSYKSYDNRIMNVGIDSTNNLWVCRNHELLTYEIQNTKSINLLNTGYEKGGAKDIAIDSTGVVWLASWGFVSRHINVEWEYFEPETPFWIEDITSIKVANNLVWTGFQHHFGVDYDNYNSDDKGGVFKFDGNTWEGFIIPVNRNRFINDTQDIAVQKDGSVWASGSEGIRHITTDGEIIRYEIGYIQAIEVDKYGNVWAGSCYGSMNLKRPHKDWINIETFENYPEKPSISSLLAVGNEIWIGHGFGISRMVIDEQYRTDSCDFNGDGKSDITDVIASILAARNNPSDPAVDYNQNGQYSIDDAILYLLDIRSGNCIR